jgi:hypothetical protein
MGSKGSGSKGFRFKLVEPALFVEQLFRQGTAAPPPGPRAAIAMFELEGMAIAAIAQMLGVPIPGAANGTTVCQSP